MTFAKMDEIIRRNAEKAQQAKAYNQQQSTHFELLKQESAPEPQKHTESSISIPSLAYSIQIIPSMTLPKKNSEGGCRRRRIRGAGRDYNDNCFSFK